MKVTVNEIFYSIQGESVHSGLPCVFIRLTGCNLRCHYCDTQYAFVEGSTLTIPQIVKKVEQFECNLVEITGGEPLIQDGTADLATTLLESGYQVLVETNGSIDINRVDRRCSRIMDIKCPSSGEQHQNDLDNLSRLTAHDQVKFVIGNEKDFRFAVSLLSRFPAHVSRDRILFSTVAGLLDPALLARWVLDEQVGVRLQIQLHKVLWPDENRGV